MKRFPKRGTTGSNSSMALVTYCPIFLKEEKKHYKEPPARYACAHFLKVLPALCFILLRGKKKTRLCPLNRWEIVVSDICIIASGWKSSSLAWGQRSKGLCRDPSGKARPEPQPGGEYVGQRRSTPPASRGGSA